jgi:ADP-ribose pyrophosphatase
MKIIQRQQEYTGRAFNVERVLVQLPDGAERHYDLVQHPDSVSIVPLTRDGQLILVSQQRLGAGKDLLEFPAGVMEAGEDPAACAERELREETGFAPGTLVKLGEAHLTPGYCTELMHFYFAARLYPAPLKMDDDEALEVVFMNVSDALALARQGSTFDSKTLAALFLAEERLRTE